MYLQRDGGAETRLAIWTRTRKVVGRQGRVAPYLTHSPRIIRLKPRGRWDRRSAPRDGIFGIITVEVSKKLTPRGAIEETNDR